MNVYRKRLNELSTEVIEAIFEKNVDFTKAFEADDKYGDTYKKRVEFLKKEGDLEELPFIDFRHPFSGNVIPVYVLSIVDKRIHVLDLNNDTEYLDISDIASVDGLVTLLEFI